MRLTFAALLALWLAQPCACAAASARRELIVSAAASLKEVLVSAAPLFEKQAPSVKLLFNFGASGQLKAQIESGAPADVFISAAAADLDSLEKAGLTVDGSRRVLARNRLVLVGSLSARKKIRGTQDLAAPEVERIALGNPATVPAGRYARQALEKRGLYEALSPKLILAESVRQVLDYVARGEADAGFVYATDARITPEVRVAEVIPAADHAPIVYPAAALKNGANPGAALKFLDFLASGAGRKVFASYGFR